MKYKVGEKVQVVSKNGYPAHQFAIGAVVTVVNTPEKCHGSLLCEGRGPRGDHMTQFVNPCDVALLLRKIVITTDGETTTARMFDGKEQVKSATAKCSKSDTFCFETGAALAMERLLCEEEKKAPEFSKADLRDGMFCHMRDGSWFVIVGDLAVCDDGCFCLMHELDDDLSWPIAGPIEVVLEGVECFNIAKLQGPNSRHIKYVRPGVTL